MDKFVISYVDTDMVDDAFFLFGGVKKYEIPCFEFVSADFVADFCLLDGGAGEADAVFVADIAGEAGTVEGFGAVGTPYVFFAEMLLSLFEQWAGIFDEREYLAEGYGLVRYLQCVSYDERPFW